MNRWIVVSPLFLSALLAGCTPARTTPPEPEGPRCNPFVLENGQRICLHSEPLTTRVPTSREGARIEALTDPNFIGPLLPSVDLRSGALAGCLQVRNQGECGWCVAHAVGSALDALYCAEGCPSARVSMPHLWESGHAGSLGDCQSGWFIEPAMDAASSSPLVSESVWPYSGTPRSMGSTRPSEAELMMDPRYAATGRGDIASSHDDAQLESMKRALSSGRMLVVTSGVCFNNGWAGGNSTLQAPTGPCAADGVSQYDGYHAWTIVGYDDTTMEFIALNSWGEDWGDGGYFRISYAFAQQELGSISYFQQIDRTYGGCEMDPMEERPTAADRCAAITDCANCAATTGCIVCDGTCMADTVATVCRETLTTANECPVPTSECSANTDCGSCAAAPGCAWCQGRLACVRWPEDHVSCDGFGTRVAYLPSQCNDATRACEAATTCEDCAALSGCGWCAEAGGTLHAGATGNCFGGTTTPDRVSCDMSWTPPGGMCPVPDAGTGPEGGLDPDGGIVTPPTCDGLGCGDCVTTPGCAYCTGSSSCVSATDTGACAGGASTDPMVCAVCNPVRGVCVTRNDCCGADGNANIQCLGTYCEDVSMCGANGSACDASNPGEHCCGAQICGQDTGGRWECCGIPGEACTSSADCCGFEVCSGGICQPQPTGARCMNTQECIGLDYCTDAGVCGT